MQTDRPTSDAPPSLAPLVGCSKRADLAPRLALRELTLDDEARFGAAMRAFASSDPDWAFAFHFDPDEDFASYLHRLRRHQLGQDLPAGWVAHTFLIAVVGEDVIGRVSIRHELNPFLQQVGGHVGYGVVPGHRNRGYATEMLRLTLPLARGLGLDAILLTCDADNSASIRTIERNGGVFTPRSHASEPPPGHSPMKRRYWIQLT